MRNTWLDTLNTIASKNKKIVFIGSDLGVGVMNNFRKKFPKRFFMEGISEQHIIGMAAGMAMKGFIPYVNTIATFLTRRCLEQNMIDLCLHNLPVRLVGNGGGLVYSPLGPTHQAIEDIAIMNTMPNMSIFAVCDSNEMKQLIYQSQKYNGPMYIRLGRGFEKIVTQKKKFIIGKIVKLKKPKKITIVSTGSVTQDALRASEILSSQGIQCGVLHVPTLKPFDAKGFIKLLKNVKQIVSVEEHIKTGGLGSIILNKLNDFNLLKKIKLTKISLPDTFNTKYGSHDELKSYYGLDQKNIIKVIKKINNEK